MVKFQEYQPKEARALHTQKQLRAFFIISDGQDINFIRSKLEDNQKQDSLAEDPERVNLQ